MRARFISSWLGIFQCPLLDSVSMSMTLMNNLSSGKALMFIHLRARDFMAYCGLSLMAAKQRAGGRRTSSSSRPFSPVNITFTFQTCCRWCWHLLPAKSKRAEVLEKVDFFQESEPVVTSLFSKHGKKALSCRLRCRYTNHNLEGACCCTRHSKRNPVLKFAIVL